MRTAVSLLARFGLAVTAFVLGGWMLPWPARVAPHPWRPRP